MIPSSTASEITGNTYTYITVVPEDPVKESTTALKAIPELFSWLDYKKHHPETPQDMKQAIEKVKEQIVHKLYAVARNYMVDNVRNPNFPPYSLQDIQKLYLGMASEPFFLNTEQDWTKWPLETFMWLLDEVLIGLNLNSIPIATVLIRAKAMPPVNTVIKQHPTFQAAKGYVDHLVKATVGEISEWIKENQNSSFEEFVAYNLTSYMMLNAIKIDNVGVSKQKTRKHTKKLVNNDAIPAAPSKGDGKKQGGTATAPASQTTKTRPARAMPTSRPKYAEEVDNEIDGSDEEQVRRRSGSGRKGKKTKAGAVQLDEDEDDYDENQADHDSSEEEAAHPNPKDNPKVNKGKVNAAKASAKTRDSGVNKIKNLPTGGTPLNSDQEGDTAATDTVNDTGTRRKRQTGTRPNKNAKLDLNPSKPIAQWTAQEALDVLNSEAVKQVHRCEPIHAALSSH